jgi:hypothetical protein
MHYAKTASKLRDQILRFSGELSLLNLLTSAKAYGYISNKGLYFKREKNS